LSFRSGFFESVSTTVPRFPPIVRGIELSPELEVVTVAAVTEEFRVSFEDKDASDANFFPFTIVMVKS